MRQEQWIADMRVGIASYDDLLTIVRKVAGFDKRDVTVMEMLMVVGSAVYTVKEIDRMNDCEHDWNISEDGQTRRCRKCQRFEARSLEAMPAAMMEVSVVAEPVYQHRETAFIVDEGGVGNLVTIKSGTIPDAFGDVASWEKDPSTGGAEIDEAAMEEIGKINAEIIRLTNMRNPHLSQAAEYNRRIRALQDRRREITQGESK